MSLRLVGSLMILTAALPGQTQVDLYNQVKGSTKPVKIGSTLPATCRAGDLFLHTAVAGGQNVFACISDNIWVPQGGGSLTIQGDGVAVGTESIQNFMAGFGILKTLSNIDSRVDIGYTIDSAVVQTHEVARALVAAVESSAKNKSDVILGATAVLLGEQGLAAQRAEHERIAGEGVVPLIVTLVEHDGKSVALMVTVIPMAPATLH